jgi:hypothetical protein
LVAKGIDITLTPKVLNKVMIKKDVRKELKLLDNVTMDEDLHATNNESNEDSMVPSNQNEAKEYHILNFELAINKSL